MRRRQKESESSDRVTTTGERGEIKVFMRMERTMMAGSEERVVREMMLHERVGSVLLRGKNEAEKGWNIDDNEDILLTFETFKIELKQNKISLRVLRSELCVKYRAWKDWDVCQTIQAYLISSSLVIRVKSHSQRRKGQISLPVEGSLLFSCFYFLFAIELGTLLRFFTITPPYYLI